MQKWAFYKNYFFLFFFVFFLLKRIVPVCDCCCIILTALKYVVAAVMLSTLLSLGYFELGCHDPSLKYNNNQVIVPDPESFTYFSNSPLKNQNFCILLLQFRNWFYPLLLTQM